MVTNAAAIIPALLNMTKRLPVREVGTPLITSMTPRWTEFLRSNGATIHGTCVMTFGDGNRELLAARNGAILAPLSKFGLLSITGEDAAAFLHSQLSSDVNALLVSQAQYASYCSAKGRVLANFLLWREPAGYSALLSRDLLESMRKRLAMFVLRSKVKIEDASEQRVVLSMRLGAFILVIKVDAKVEFIFPDCTDPPPGHEDRADNPNSLNPRARTRKCDNVVRTKHIIAPRNLTRLVKSWMFENGSRSRSATIASPTCLRNPRT